MSACLLTFDVEDWFQVENLRPLFPLSAWETMPRRVVASTSRILDVLDRHGVRSTFFVLGWVADREPGLVREIARRGHEVACHGYSHVLPMQMTLEEFRADITRAKARLEDVSGQVVAGFRAPSFSVDRDRLSVVAECGFAYDSSHHPFALHNRYGQIADMGPPVAPGVYRLPNGLLEVSLPVERFGPVSIPVAGGAWFRLYPAGVYRALAMRTVRRWGHFAFYLHSWELDPDQPRVTGVSFLSRARHYTNLRRTESRLVALIRRFDRAAIPFQTIAGFLAESIKPAGANSRGSGGHHLQETK